MYNLSKMKILRWGTWLLTERKKKKKKGTSAVSRGSFMSSARQRKDQSSLTVYPWPVRRQSPRFQASGYTIHIVQISWSRPGSSQIPRLGGQANGALGNPTDSYCNPHSKGPTSFAKTHGQLSPCRDNTTPTARQYSCSQIHNTWEEREYRSKRSKWMGENATCSLTLIHLLPFESFCCNDEKEVAPWKGGIEKLGFGHTFLLEGLVILQRILLYW